MASLNDTSADEPVAPRSHRAELAEAPDAIQLSRRTLCSVGAGLSALALLGLPGMRAVSAERSHIRYVLTDQRYAQSLEFGTILSRQDSERLEVTDGLTRLWLDALVPLWREKEGVIAGLTLRATWECIAEQARSCGRRTVLVGHHASVADANVINHVLTAPRPVLERATALKRNIEPWPRVMAHLAVQCPTNMRPCPDSRFQSPAAAASAPSTLLTSWVIA